VTLAEKMARRGPKRLLALDGGGIRGLISVEVLAEIEMRLGRELDAGPGFVLADYFDYIAGTSTGGIIAVLLSLGWSAARIRAFYVDHGREMFRHAIAPWRIYRSLYRATDLRATLAKLIGPDTTLGSEQLRTLLLLVMRNANTDSPWPLSNNPAAKYNTRGDANCNLDLPLWQLVRASAAAPLFFPPEILRVGRTRFAFTDGGMTSYNNPAFLLFLMATLAPYNLGWPIGEDRLLLVSIGTGTNPRPRTAQTQNIFTGIMSVLMDPRFAALVQQDVLCRVFGKCLAGDAIDGEIGDLMDAAASPFPKHFTYVRYNGELSRSGLDALQLPDVDPLQVGKLDSVAHIGDLCRVGRAIAEREVRIEHFRGFLSSSP
jgi:patatin-like phospholipase/acyl hydrolase